VCNDYIGTIEVINAFEKNNLKTVNKMKVLQNLSNIDWKDFKNQDRVKNIKNVIKEIGRA
jgi:hypothetical protein